MASTGPSSSPQPGPRRPSPPSSDPASPSGGCASWQSETRNLCTDSRVTQGISVRLTGGQFPFPRWSKRVPVVCDRGGNGICARASGASRGASSRSLAGGLCLLCVGLALHSINFSLPGRVIQRYVLVALDLFIPAAQSVRCGQRREQASGRPGGGWWQAATG